jgi:crotonobetainyl-CoA:carnitine CoA-transferase CaiB-like acyl-CoA transferase
MGLDEASVRSINPRAVLVTQSAFGDVGPYTRRGGFDGVGQALSGAMYITGTPGAPAKAAAPYVDFTTAVLSAFGALAALMERNRSGIGQRVDATLLGSAMAVFNSHLIEQSVTGIGRVGTGNRVQNVCTFRRICHPRRSPAAALCWQQPVSPLGTVDGR